MKANTKRILIISDLHFPYAHDDWYKFLKEIKRKYSPTLVVSIGDIFDFHSISYHEHNPNLKSPLDEWDVAKKESDRLHKLFPEMVIVDSNHDSLILRKQISAGLPHVFSKSLGEVLGYKKWQWVNDLTLTLPDGEPIYICHGMSSNGLRFAQRQTCSVIQGHYHTKSGVEYSASPLRLIWSMQVGCLVNAKSLAMAYQKTNVSKPILSVGVVIDSIPHIEPMSL